MASQRRRVLPGVAFALAIAGAAVVAIAVVLGVVGAAVGPPREPSPLVVVSGTALLASPLITLVAIVAGHLSRRRYPQSETGRIGLIVGYVVAMVLVMLLILGILTWFTIS